MGKYTRKTNRRNYKTEALLSAMNAVEQGQKIRAAARDYDIHEATLRRQLKIKGKFKQRKSDSLGRAPVFTEEQEREFASHCKELARLFFGITATDLREAAFKYAEANHIKHSFNREKGMAGPDWFRNFLKRNPDLSLRKPEATSVNRISAFNKTEVDRFFNNLEQVQDKYHFGPDRIYNVDETGCSTTPREVSKRLAPTGLKQFGTITSWERGKNVTVICAVSATGAFVPPLFIFPRLRMSPHLERNGPAGAVYTCTKNGWSNEEVFMMWLKHFQAKVSSTIDNPVLLILDNHSSHISITIYEFCKNHGIVMLSIPPHTSHRLQPLDLTFFAALKSAYSRQCNLFLKRKITCPEKENKLTPYDISEIFKLAYEQVANVEKGVSGFAAAGIFPMNPEKFTEDDFAPAENFNSSLQSLEGSPSCRESTPPKIIKDNENSKSSQQPSTSYQIPVQAQEQTYFLPDLTPVAKILPIPRSTKIQMGKKGREKQHSEVLTSTPMKGELEKKEDKRNKKKVEASKKNILNPKQKKVVKKANKTKKCVNKDDIDSESDLSDIDETKLCNDDELDDMSDASEHDKCVICGDLGKNKEMWYRCTTCGYWAHQECSGYDSPTGYVCDLCQP